MCVSACAWESRGSLPRHGTFQEEYQAEETLQEQMGRQGKSSRMQKSPDPLTPTSTSHARPLGWALKISWELT